MWLVIGDDGVCYPSERPSSLRNERHYYYRYCEVDREAAALRRENANLRTIVDNDYEAPSAFAWLMGKVERQREALKSLEETNEKLREENKRLKSKKLMSFVRGVHSSTGRGPDS